MLVYSRDEFMARNWLPIAVTVTLILFFTLSGLFGPHGIQATRELEELYEQLLQEYGTLTERNRELALEKKLLENDYERIMEEAYSYGYLQEDELRLVLEENFSVSSPETAEEQSQEISRLLTDWRSRDRAGYSGLFLISLGGGGAVFCIMLLVSRLRKGRSKQHGGDPNS